MENLTEVLIWSFPKTDVPFMMRIETQVLKNKVFKTQGPELYLTIFLSVLHVRTLHNIF
jgi:hypothetical protein